MATAPAPNSSSYLLAEHSWRRIIAKLSTPFTAHYSLSSGSAAENDLMLSLYPLFEELGLVKVYRGIRRHVGDRGAARLLEIKARKVVRAGVVGHLGRELGSRHPRGRHLSSGSDGDITVRSGGGSHASRAREVLRRRRGLQLPWMLLLLSATSTTDTTDTALNLDDDAFPVVTLTLEGTVLLLQTINLRLLVGDEVGAALAAAAGGLVIALALLFLVLFGLSGVVLAAALVLLDGEPFA
ncbi:hypothetical protein PG989_005366 [Apiospora arundinis]|uniref:Uncharacterized protein n=1 Tax=Apiospora arundinis TaxID=335852 RepID=A0ABR2IV03_9PEZI